MGPQLKDQAVIGHFPAPFMGIDRDTRARITDDWFEALYESSNFRFLGAYLTHVAVPNTPAGQALYTRQSMAMERQWTQTWSSLEDQGWGCAFFYVGFFSPRGPSQREDEAKASGILHARHIKVTVSEFLSIYGSDNSGTVVFLDNEPKGAIAQSPTLRLYYNSLFAELRVPGPGTCQPVRPGLYSRDRPAENPEELNASEMVHDNPDLFLWLVDYRGEAVRKGPSGRKLPIPDEVGRQLHLNPDPFDIRSYRYTVTSGRSTITIPVGIQGFIDYGTSTGFPKMPSHQLTRTLAPVDNWDFDMSFVRDPRYPEACPRIRAVRDTIVRGYFDPPLQSLVRISQMTSSQDLYAEPVEPDAPLLFADPNTFITLAVRGRLVFSQKSSLGNWEPLTMCFPTPKTPPLRRARAITAITLSNNTVHIFYIANNLTIQTVQRPVLHGAWLDPVAITQPAGSMPPIHAFSNITCVTNNQNPPSVSLFTLSPSGHIMATTYTLASVPGAKGTTSFESLPHDKVDEELLLGSALIAFSPHPAFKIVVGVSKQLKLKLYSNFAGKGWSATTLGRPHIGTVFAHTRLAYHIINPNAFEIAAISLKGVPMIFTITLNTQSQKWSLEEPHATSMLEIPNPNPRLLPRPNSRWPLKQGERLPRPIGRVASAEVWSINPFSDLNFATDPSGVSDTVLICAGSGPDNAVGELYRRVRRHEDWFRIE